MGSLLHVKNYVQNYWFGNKEQDTYVSFDLFSTSL